MELCKIAGDCMKFPTDTAGASLAVFSSNNYLLSQLQLLLMSCLFMYQIIFAGKFLLGM
jgi:hypothetical protein